MKHVKKLEKKNKKEENKETSSARAILKKSPIAREQGCPEL